MLTVLITGLFLIPLAAALVISARHLTADPGREPGQVRADTPLTVLLDGTPGWTDLDDLQLNRLLSDPPER